jgi:hypothetical protein
MLNVGLQRVDWTGTPYEIGDLFRLTKGHHRARCLLTNHPFGWECRLLVGPELLQSRVCRSQDEVLGTGEQWKAGMLEKGWSE